ncbi:MAG: transposase [Candidatus Nitrosocosmicus sp.]
MYHNFIDCSGIKIINRGQWMDKKWKVQNRKKGYLKIHIAVNIKTKEILALELSYKKVHDGKMLTKLVDQVFDGSSTTTTSDTKSNNQLIKIKSVSAD